MFLRFCSPRSANSMPTLPLTWSYAEDEMQNTAWFCDAFEPRRNVYAVPKNVMRFDNHVAYIDAHPKGNVIVFRLIDRKFRESGSGTASRPEPPLPRWQTPPKTHRLCFSRRGHRARRSRGRRPP